VQNLMQHLLQRMRVPTHVLCPRLQQRPPHLRTWKREHLRPRSLFPLSLCPCFRLIQCLLLQCTCAWTCLNSCGCGCGLSVDYIDYCKIVCICHSLYKQLIIIYFRLSVLCTKNNSGAILSGTCLQISVAKVTQLLPGRYWRRGGCRVALRVSAAVAACWRSSMVPPVPKLL